MSLLPRSVPTLVLVGTLTALAAVVLWALPDPILPPARADETLGEVVLDVKSEYSRIKVRKFVNTYTLLFVRDNGDEVIESMIDRSHPQDLLIDYTKYMFLSYLFRPKQEKVLIVGLGGGSMIHFMAHHDPNAKVDVVEIDPVIVKVADKFFGARTGGNIRIVTEDAFKYLRETPDKYDVVYMDAFLKPTGATDTTGVPLRLKTIEFYKGIQSKLSPGGLVVFNINPHDGIEADVKTISEAFPQTYSFYLPNAGGLVVVGSMQSERLDPRELAARARTLDDRFKPRYSYREMVGRLGR